MYVPKVFTQVLFKLPAAADAAALIIAMVNRQVQTALPDLKCGCLAALVAHAPSRAPSSGCLRQHSHSSTAQPL